MRRLILSSVALALAACGSPRAESKTAKAPAPEAAATNAGVVAPVDEEAALAAAALTMIRALYALPNEPAGARIPTFFAEDLAAALAADATRAGGPQVESDYRYGGQPAPYSDLTIESEGTNVRVEFVSDGTSHSYLWAFCSRDDGQVRVEDLIFDDNSLTSVLEVEGGGAC